MPWAKAAVNGALGSLVMVLIMQMALSGVLPLDAPFNVPPSSAVLHGLGLDVTGLALLLHFGYGAVWSVVLLWLFWDRTTTLKGIGLALVLWLGMMLILSPVLGWGVFGWSGTPDLPREDPLFLTGGPRYAVMTLLLHVIYGAIIGVLNRRWVKFGQEVAEEIRQAARDDEI